MVLFLFLTYSLFTIIYNIVTVVTIIRNRTEPWFKIKFSLVLDAIMCLLLGWLWLSMEHIGTYDLVWMLIYLSLMIWYAYILSRRKRQ